MAEPKARARRATNARSVLREMRITTRVLGRRDGLLLRIPRTLATEAGLHAGAEVELSLVDGALSIQGVPQTEPRLQDLLRAITDANLHREWDTGPAVGGEVW